MKKSVLWLAVLLMLVSASAPTSADETAGRSVQVVEKENGANAEVFLQLGHSSEIESVVFSPDGKYALSGSRDSTLKLWDIASGREIRSFKGHTESVRSVAFSRDGQYALSGSDDNSMKLWEVVNGAELRTFKGHLESDAASVTSVAFSPDGKYALSGSNDKTLKLWDIASGREIRTFKGHADRVDSVAFSPDGRLALSGSEDNTMKLWEIASGREIRSFKKHEEFINSVAFSPDGKTALSGSEDNTRMDSTGHSDGVMMLWDIKSGREIRSFRGHAHLVSSVAFSPDGKFLLSGSYDNTLKLWNVASGREIRTFKGHEGRVHSVAFSSDGRYVLSCGDDKTLKLWEVSSGREIRTFAGHLRMVESLAVSPDGQLALTGSWGDTSLKLWDVANGRQIRTFKGHQYAVASAVFSADGRYVLSGSGDATVKLWETASGKEIRTFKGHYGPVLSVAISPDGMSALSGSDDESLMLFDLSRGRQLRIFKGHSGHVTSVAFSPDGRVVLSGSRNGRNAFAINRKLWEDDLVNTLKLWDVASGREIRSFIGHSNNVSSVAFSPDGRSALSGSSDKTVKLWDVASGREIRTFMGHSDAVTSVAYSPDGRLALSGSADKSLKLWDVASGSEFRTLAGHLHWVTSVRFSPDGRSVLSGSWDGTVLNWDINTGKEIAQFVSFTDGEWVVITPEGYYNSSENGDKHLNVRIGNNVYGVNQYREAFYRPDLVKIALAGGSLKDFRGIASVKQPPSVSIVNTVGETNKDEATITVKLLDIGGGIGDIRLYLNGSAVILDSGSISKVQEKTESGSVYKSYRVKLTSGLNMIRAIAFNADNTMQSTDAVRQIKANFKAISKPSLYALVIGINEFKNPKLKLNYPVADAELFASTLENGASRMFEKVIIKKLLGGPETTNENIVRELKAFQSLKPDDLFVFFVASHGTVDDGEYFLITSNVGSTRTEKLKTDAISQTVFKELISNIPTTKKLLVIDTCNAGALGDAVQVAMLTRGMSEDTAMKVLSRAVGSTILSASTSVQEALEGYKGHGLFTYVLTEGLSGKADKSRSGYVKTTELADYVDNEVPALAEKVFKRAQYPTISISGQGFPVGQVR